MNFNTVLRVCRGSTLTHHAQPYDGSMTIQITVMSKQDHSLLCSDLKSTEMWQDKRLWHSGIFRYVCAVQPYACSGCQGFYAYAYSSILVVYWDEEHLSCLTFFFPINAHISLGWKDICPTIRCKAFILFLIMGQ